MLIEKKDIKTRKLVILIIISILLSITITGCDKKLSKEYVELLTQSQSDIDKGDFDGALLAVNQAVLMNKEAPEAYVQKGFIHIAKGEYNQASDALNYAMDHIKDFIEEESIYAAYLNMGNLQYQRGDLTTSLNYFSEALKRDDTDSNLHNSIGLVYTNLGDFDKAKEYYFKALELDDGNAYAYANLATIFLNELDYPRGLNEINTAINLNSHIPQFYMIKGELLLKQELLDEALVTYSEAISKWSTFGDAYYKRGEIYLGRQDYLNSIMDFSSAKEYGIKEGDLGMGYSYSGLGQFQEAIDAYVMYLSSREDIDLKALYEIGVAYYKLENYQETINTFKEFLELEPKDIEVMLILAYAYEQLEMYDDAYALLDQILTIDSNNEKAKSEKEFIEDHGLLD